MVAIRSVNEIILSLVDHFKLSQPDLDTKPGTVAKDLFIDAPATQVSLLYNELSGISNKQSLRLVVGSDLDRLAKNFGITRKQPTPSTGVALLTFSSITAPVNINRGDRIIAANGFSYSVISGLSVVPSATNLYRSIATKFREQLSIAGISDEYAVEVTVIATTSGSVGNIGSYSLNKTSIGGVSNVTNINSFNGGTDQETDVAFRNRILSSFSGSSVGTSLGYLNVALSTPGVIDAFVVEPGNILMTRDGTKLNKTGTKILSEGSGGKVDIITLGSSLLEDKDTFIYLDKSNTNDATSSKNNIVIGQIEGDKNKTINKKRFDNIKAGILPAQPVSNILEVSGSVSGSNYTPKKVDMFGRVSGNYELIKDQGVYSGSPWGFDTFHWISNKISLFSEDRIKGQFNGQDTVTFTDVLNIPKIEQTISIINENSIVTSDRSIIQLLHTPATNVTRVFNVNTGERYLVPDQNLDKTGTYNTTGRIKISGNTLPSPSDQLQVDYNWIVTYDEYANYDGLGNTNNIRTVTDSIDWGYSSIIRGEKIRFSRDINNDFFIGSSSHPISVVVSANLFTEITGFVKKINTGLFINRLAVSINNLSKQTFNIDSISFKNHNSELYKTAQSNGTFFSTPTIVGIDILYNTTIILPTDTAAQDGDAVTVYLDNINVFTDQSIVGDSSTFQVTIPTSLIDSHFSAPIDNVVLKVDYISNVSEMFSLPIASLPVTRVGNSFSYLNNSGFNNFSFANSFRREHQTVQLNPSNQPSIDLSISNTEINNLKSEHIISVIRLSDGLELWSQNNLGSISTTTSNNYQLIFSGVNNPIPGEKVLAIYYAHDSKRFQPFSFDQSIIKSKVETVAVEPGNKFSVSLNSFTDQNSAVSFSIMDPTHNTEILSVSDGVLISGGSKGFLSSNTNNFSTIPDLINKKIKITDATTPTNNGIYDIIDYSSIDDTITITNLLNNISHDQISVIRILDGKEVWNYKGTINYENDKIIFAADSGIQQNDQVYVLYFNTYPLRQSPSRLILNTTDQVINSGTLSIQGVTINKVQDVVFTATATGLKINLLEAIKKHLDIGASNIPNNIRLARIKKLEKVTTVSNNNDEVIQVVHSYDVHNSVIQNNLLYPNECLMDASLQNLEFILPNTSNNTLQVGSKYLPTLGDKFRVTFYYTIENDQENVSYTKNGILYTNKTFALINKIVVSSGFKSSQSTKLSVTSLVQPTLGSRYKVFYDYVAPKQNERIVIRYNYNKLISDVTFNIEQTRPINADVLVKEAKKIPVNLNINVVIDGDFKTSINTILQNLRDKLISIMTVNKLGGVIDSVNIINTAQSVKGIARARILHFNKVGSPGQVLLIQAAQNEYLAPNDIVINTETR